MNLFASFPSCPHLWLSREHEVTLCDFGVHAYHQSLGLLTTAVVIAVNMLVYAVFVCIPTYHRQHY